MLRFLIAIDGSTHAERAAECLIRLIGKSGMSADAVDVHLLNVRVERFSALATEQEKERFYAAKSAEAFRTVVARLGAAGIPCARHTRAGDVPESIVQCAQELACDAIVMGTHGIGGIAGLVLGSVANKVVQLSPIPVTLVK